MLDPQLTLRSSRLLLRPFHAGDAAETFACITQTLARFMSWEPPADLAQFGQIWTTWLSAMAQGQECVFVVRRQTDAHFLGLAGLHHLTAPMPELGIWIREDQHRHGYGLEAVRLVAQWASRTLAVQGFVYPVAEENRPSRRIAEALGGEVFEQVDKPKYRAVIYRLPLQAHAESPPWQLQRARQTDQDAILALHRAGLEETGSWSDDPTLDVDLAAIEHHYAAPGLFLLARTADGQLAGMAALRPCAAQTFEVKRMRVAAPWRGQGLGAQLLSALIAHARQHGARYLQLDTGQNQHAAQRLYARFGFVRQEAVVIAGVASWYYQLALDPR